MSLERKKSEIAQDTSLQVGTSNFEDEHMSSIDGSRVLCELLVFANKWVRLCLLQKDENSLDRRMSQNNGNTIIFPDDDTTETTDPLSCFATFRATRTTTVNL
jgi:hypothetical protein